MSSHIGIDWGSTNLRAWYCQHGEYIETRRLEAGITRLNGPTPAEIFDSITHGWPVQDVPVVMTGMIGSNAGWVPVPYLSCPVVLNELCHHLTRVENKVWIVPGLSVERADNRNVIRGEETQLPGATQLQPAPLYVMPGTHARWVQTEGALVLDFRTVMTGELHHLLLRQSLIGAGLPTQQEDATVFHHGLETGINDASIMSRLFEVRAAHVLGALDRRYVSEFLSGLLIGHEVTQMTQQAMVDRTQPVVVIADEALAQRYCQALNLIDLKSVTLAGDCAFRQGIRRIANELAN